ncbi:MAG: HigA family addiction module antitoxin [Hyphomicrobium sp.]|jgi:addiction module HigA family antidote|nr:HigA family addiction module antitoxin [Hyphomicrobium sp.]
MGRVRTHPGEVLREEFLKPLELSAHQLADALEVPANRISEILRERRSVTADTALRLAAHFKTTPEFWLNLQMAHDLSKAEAAMPAARRSHAGRKPLATT